MIRREWRNAPAAGAVLCPLAGVPDAGCRELRYGTDEDVFSLLIYRRDRQVWGYVNRCPHFSLPLNSRPEVFLLLPNSQIMCSYHSAVFRLVDGVCVSGPARGLGLQPVPLVLRDDQIHMGAD